MTHTQRRILTLCTAISIQRVIASQAGAFEPAEVFPLWPAKPPGQTQERGPEKLVEGRPRPFYQITDVSKPTVSVYLPPKARRTGAAVLVCPGGGLQRLAIEHEGIEVAQWLASLDISVFVLKYRVPERAQVALQDAQRALSLIRSRAGEWAVDPDDIGVIGFSAGAEVAAWLATHHKERQYESIDASDRFSCRPAYAALVYPGGLVQGAQGQLKAPIASRLDAETPPMFVAQAFDDSSENSLAMVTALKRARVPAELHIFQEGGHGFGVRQTGVPTDAWKERWLAWMQSQGFLDKAFVRNYARELSRALPNNVSIPRFSSSFPHATLVDAYSAQRRVVRAALKEDRIAGFKGIALTQAAQKSLGVDRPLTGVLFRSGQLKAADSPVIDLATLGDTGIAAGLGYVISVDISYEILNDAQARGAVMAIIPVVEFPVNSEQRTGKMSAIDLVAANASAKRYIVGSAKSMTSADLDSAKITLKRNDQLVREAASGTPTRSGQWHDLRRLLNQITAQGYVLHAGDLILCGTSEMMQRGAPGKYQADFGAFGNVEFELR